MHLSVEHAEIEGKSQADWINGLELFLGDCYCLGVCKLGEFHCLGSFLSLGELSNVPGEVALDFEVEDVHLRIGGVLDKLIIDHVDNLVAVAIELALDHFLLSDKQVQILRPTVLFLFNNLVQHLPLSPLLGDDLFVSGAQHIPLIHGKIGVGQNYLLDHFKHVLIPFTLFCYFGDV